MSDVKRSLGIAPDPGSPEEGSVLKGASRIWGVAGVGLILAGLVVALVRKSFAPHVGAYVPLGLGLALLVSSVVLNLREVGGALSGRTGAGALNTAAVIAASIVIWFGVNYFGSRFHHTWNVSRGTFSRISDKSQKVVRGLEKTGKEVQVVVLGYQHGDLELLLSAYDRAGEKLKVRHVYAGRDNREYEDLLKKLKLEESTPDSLDLIVACGDRAKVVRERDLYAPVHPYLRGRVPRHIDEDVENEITSAVLSVSEETQTKVRFTSGHGERDPENYHPLKGLAKIKGLLERDNYDVQKLQTMGPSILEDCDVLVIAGAHRRFADHELELVEEYLRKGGKLLVLLEPQAETGLEEVLAGGFGVQTGRDIVVEPNPNYRWGRRGAAAFYAFPEPHPLTQSLIEMDYHVIVEGARTVRAAPAQGPTPYQAMPILAANKTAYGETDFEALEARGFSARDENDVHPATLGVALSRRPPHSPPGIAPPAEPQGPDTRIVVLGDADLATERLIENNPPNGDLVLNAVRWLAAKERHLGIEKRQRQREQLDAMTNQQERALHFLVVIGLPFLAVILGGLIWWVRRR